MLFSNSVPSATSSSTCTVITTTFVVLPLNVPNDIVTTVFSVFTDTGTPASSLTYVSPVGSVSTTSPSSQASVPLFSAVIVYLKVSPACTSSASDVFVTLCSTTLGSLGSVPVASSAVTLFLITSPGTAVLFTLTVIYTVLATPGDKVPKLMVRVPPLSATVTPSVLV